VTDVVTVSPYLRTAAAAAVPGGAAAAAEDRKRTRYAALDSTRYAFAPVGYDMIGAPGPSAKKVLKRLSARIADRMGQPRPVTLLHHRTEMQALVQRKIAQLLLVNLENAEAGGSDDDDDGAIREDPRPRPAAGRRVRPRSRADVPVDSLEASAVATSSGDSDIGIDPQGDVDDDVDDDGSGDAVVNNTTTAADPVISLDEPLVTPAPAAAELAHEGLSLDSTPFGQRRRDGDSQDAGDAAQTPHVVNE